MTRSLRYILATALCLWCPAPVFTQISPGELSSAHSSLEGIGSCTSCHELGKAVVNNKCLECHKELRTRITAGTGFHGPLAGRQCVECHKEHLGRSFKLVRFDRSTYDHGRVGFPLAGKHARLDCERCHTAEFRKAADVRQNPALLSSKTFLGLSRECVACHKDVHKGQLNTACQQCHGLDGWKPPAAFSHDRARFRLTGKHAMVPCAKCHPVPQGGGPPSYARMNFSLCTACHTDPHGGKFQKPCDACHSTQGWSEGVARGFDHTATKFPLRGAHRTVRCTQCHTPSAAGTEGPPPSRRFTIKRFGQCGDCHADVHRGEFAQRPGAGACETCHTETAFSPSKFLHTSAAYQLEGRHANVSCERCHTALTAYRAGKGTLDLRIAKRDRCADCHADGHGGQLSNRSDRGECGSCHTVKGYAPSTFSVADHASTRFALAGAHGALPCAACHRAGTVQAKSTRQLRWSGLPRCETCHKDPHGGQFTGRQGQEGCASCHTTPSWQTLAFAHERTKFPLTGRHAAVPCVACHKSPPGANGQARRFAGTPMRCVDCHNTPVSKAGLE
jgi:predicted CXXCH cytochrome family protein